MQGFGAANANDPTVASASGRVPPPPSLGVGYSIFAAVGALVLLAPAALLAWWTATDSAELGPLIWFAWGFAGLMALGGVAIIAVNLIARRMKPGQELCWSPVTPGQGWQVSFVSQKASYHGLWMNYDVHYQGDSYGVGQLHCHVEIYVAGQLVEQRVITTAWSNRCGRSGFATGVRGGDLPPGTERAIREVDCGVSDLGPMRLSGQAGPLRFQALSLLHKIDVDPGQAVTVRGMLHPPTFPCQQLRAHTFIAGSRG